MWQHPKIITISKGKIECFVCKGNHRLYECTTFKEKTPEDRNSVVSTFNLCVNCLRPGHNVQACKLPGACRQCKQKHNTLLHVSNNTTSISMSAFSTPEILLCTAKVRLINPHTNASITIRALLDSGSQSSFITERVKQRLKLTPQPSNVGIVGIGNSPLKLSTERCALQLQSTAHTSNTFVASLFCLVLKNITENLPKLPIDISQLNLSDYDLADPSFYEPSPIDMLIGADLFWELIGNKQHSIGTSKTHLRSSKLGWLIAGRMPHSTQSLDPKPTIRNFLLQEDQRIDQQLAKFWDLENVPQAQPYTEEENFCEKHFLSNTSRESDGRFSVGLPLKDNIDCLGESYYIAKKRFYSLESRFRKNPELKVLYSQFIKEYADCGHLSESSSSKPPNSYFLPHHPVFRDKSESTKLRVVFNASEPTTSGLSVNNLQMVGPTVQDSLFNILLRFRQYKYVLSGDIEKMYRQVRLRQSDRDLQLILWRDNEDEPLRTLRLNTVTYGFASASFLTTRCIWQIGEESVDHEIKTIIQRDFYCDDLLTGADTSTELRYIQQSIATELAKGCFPLRKYRSNLPNLIDNNCINNEKSNLIISNATSTLGVGWSPTTDDIHFPINYSDNDNHKCTKRTILSTTFKIFDPLGLISLCTIKAKIFLQMLWLKKLDWDEQVPRDILDPWEKFTKHINILSSLKIKRKVLIDDPSSVELHCFCDASQQAYGSCIYLRSEDRTGNIHVSFVVCQGTSGSNKNSNYSKTRALRHLIRCRADFRCQ